MIKLLNVCWCYYVIKCSLVCGVILLFYFLTHNRILQMVTHIGFIVVFIYRFFIGSFVILPKWIKILIPYEVYACRFYYTCILFLWSILSWIAIVAISFASGSLQFLTARGKTLTMSKCFRFSNTETKDPFKGHWTIVVYWFDLFICSQKTESDMCRCTGY